MVDGLLSTLVFVSIVAVLAATVVAYRRSGNAALLILVVAALFGRTLIDAATTLVLFVDGDVSLGFRQPLDALLGAHVTLGQVNTLEVALYYALLAASVLAAAGGAHRRG